jgi:hypothetical protein
MPKPASSRLSRFLSALANMPMRCVSACRLGEQVGAAAGNGAVCNVGIVSESARSGPHQAAAPSL